MHSQPFTFNLMPEIEDEIFERAACMFPWCAPALSVVSKRVQTRVESIMYRTLAFESIDRSDLSREPDRVPAETFALTLHARPVEFFATRVRNVCVTTSVPYEIVDLILAKCTGIQHLALWREDKPEDALVLPLSSTLCTLFTDRQVFRWMADSGAVFSQMKYLSLRYYPDEMPISTLEWLPSLITVELDVDKEPFVGDYWMEDVKMVISTASRLKSLLLNVHSLCLDIVETQIEEFGDPRIIIRDGVFHFDGIKAWRGAWGA